MEEDRIDFENEALESKTSQSSAVVTEPVDLMDGDRGVSKIMSTCFDLQDRISLLLVHGMLHLLGYDHEKDEDWLVMTAREEEIWAEYKKLLKKFPL